MVTINLLPIKAELRRKALMQHGVVFAICMAILVVALIFVQESKLHEQSQLQQDIVDTKSEIQKVTKKAGEIDDFKKRKQELERKLEIIEDLNTKKSGPVQMLDELSLIIPEKAWIKSLNITGTSLVMDGVAVDNTVIAEFMKRLQGSQHFMEVVLILAEQDGLNHKFVIQSKVKLPA